LHTFCWLLFPEILVKGMFSKMTPQRKAWWCTIDKQY